MRRKVMLFLFFGAFLGWSLGATLTASSQSGSDSLSALAQEKAEISKMDWLILNAHIRALAETLRENTHVSVFPLNYAYDPGADTIKVNALVDSSWVSKANVTSVKDMFEKRSTQFCFSVMETMITSGAAAPLFHEGHVKCKVLLFEWTIGQSGEIVRNEIAIYEDGEVILK